LAIAITVSFHYIGTMEKSERNCRVYIHRRLSDDKIFYVGKGVKRRPFSRSNRNMHWINTVNKYGYKVEIIKNWSFNECCLTYEKILIHIIGRNNLCNLTSGGEGTPGIKHSKEFGEMISRIHKGKIVSEQTKRRISLAISGELNPLWGKKLTDLHKEKISKSLSGENHPLYGKQVSPERKEKIRNALKGRKISQERKDNISKSQKGRKRSDLSKSKMSEAKKNKKIYCFRHKNGDEFFGIRFDFIEKFGVDASSVTKLINSKLKSVGGWTYVPLPNPPEPKE